YHGLLIHPGLTALAESLGGLLTQSGIADIDTVSIDFDREGLFWQADKRLILIRADITNL
ncbi:hypothetical protein BMR05_16650, partial [Methylococcaceae bacterium HT4]